MPLPGNSYSDDERAVAAGYDNGDVKLFDLRTNNMRWETNVGNGVSGRGRGRGQEGEKSEGGRSRGVASTSSHRRR